MGNFSRNTFDRLKHYVGVRLQQGVPIVDADWNELEDIRKYELQAFLKWFLGNGIPQGGDGFHILALADPANDFVITGGDGTAQGVGRCLVEGWDVLNENNLQYTQQALYNHPELAKKWGVPPLPALTTPSQDRQDTVYLDVWEREVDSSEDRNLVNPAIDIETCVRLKREWIVRVAEGAPQPPAPLPAGHVFYPLAFLNRKAGAAVIKPENIADRRSFFPRFAELSGLLQRLDKSLTKEGDLKNDLIVNAQIRADAGIEERKVLFDKNAGHEHDGQRSKKISTLNLAGVAPSVTAQNLNLLTAGISSEASALHYHRAIPVQTKQYYVPLLAPLKEPGKAEFACNVGSYACPKDSACFGYIPLDLPAYCQKIIAIGMVTFSDNLNISFSLNVYLVRTEFKTHEPIVGPVIQYKTIGESKQDYSQDVKEKCNYYLKLAFDRAPDNAALFIDKIYIEYQFSTLF